MNSLYALGLLAGVLFYFVMDYLDEGEQKVKTKTVKVHH